MIWLMLWLACGLVVFVWFHTRHWDLTVGDLGHAAVFALLWPILLLGLCADIKLMKSRRATDKAAGGLL